MVAIAIGIIWSVARAPRPPGRSAIYIADVGRRVATLWRSVADRDLWAPSWSPDGTMIAWHETTAQDAPADLLVADRDTKIPRRVAGGSHASWAPDGRRLAFESQIDEPGNFDIYVVDLVGGTPRRLTRDPALDWDPIWSPDGRSIMFTSRRTGTDQIYVVDVDAGSVERQLTSGPGSSVRATWSPDGTRIAFGSDRSGDAEIEVAHPDGTGVTPLTDNDVADWDPVWSPDGRRLVFLSYRDGVGALYTMDADGRNQVRLTEDLSMVASGGFSWSPDGTSVVHAAAARGG